MLKKSFLKLKPVIYEFLFYVAVFAFSIVSYVIFKPKYSGNEVVGRGDYAKYYALSLLLLIVFVGVFLYRLKKLDRTKLIFLLILASFVVRLCYVLYTEGIARQYDTNSDTGHYGYARTLFETGKLPDSNSYQFYHPPFNAFIQSVFMHFFQEYFNLINSGFIFLTGNKGIEMTTESFFFACQNLSLLYTVVFSVTACKIFKELEIGGTGGIIAVIFVLFYPRLIQFSGQLNNDMLCLMLIAVSVLWAIKFYKDQSWFSIVVLAVVVGLTLMTKLNGATVCLPIAILFVILFVKKIVAKERVELTAICAKYLTFIIVCAPLGLWFQVYAKIRFDQSFAYVFPYLNGNLSTADKTFAQRFFFPPPSVIFSSKYANAWEHYNLFDYTMKSSVFGEFSYWGGDGFAFLGIMLNYAYTLSFAACYAMFIFDRKERGVKIFDLPFILLSSVLFTMIISQFAFNLKMPYGCTMDFRYIVPIILAGGGLTGLMFNESGDARIVGFKTTAFINAFLAVAFVAVTSVFYFNCI